MTIQLCGSAEPAWGGELCVSGAALSVPACCVAAKGMGSACSCLYSALGTESARYEQLPCHGHCGIQINKTGAGISKQPLPRSSHLLCAFLRRGAGEGRELPAAPARGRRQPTAQRSSLQMRDTSEAAGHPWPWPCCLVGRWHLPGDRDCHV